MPYKIFKFEFQTPVHFGSNKVGTSLENTVEICHSDTFFSAICQEILKLYDEEKLLDFVDMVDSGDLIFSSLLPYNQNDLFLPKPCLMIDNIEQSNPSMASSIQKKKMKKLKYISINDFTKYIDCLKAGKSFDYDENKYDFCESQTTAKVALKNDSEKNNIYFVGNTYYKKGCGLYVIVSYELKEQIEFFETIINSLQYSGIGGKRSSGYGKFVQIDEMYPDGASNIHEEKLIFDLLENKAEYYETLSLYSPTKKEFDENNFEKAYYKIIRRNGFVYSTTYTDENVLVKRKSLSMFQEGSCFPFEIEGEVKDVSDNGNHPVYKNGKCLKIGVKL